MPGFLRKLLDPSLNRPADDDNYWRNIGYAFELVVDKGRRSVIMPILLGLEEYSFDSHFSRDVELAQFGGHHVTEYGIQLGTIRISVQPGTKIASHRARLGGSASAISGHKRFLEIREKIFWEYSDLKQDPDLGEDVLLVFHSLKDADSWVVIPDEHSLRRSSRAPASYPYSVSMTAIERYTASSLRAEDLSPDQSLFDKLAQPAHFLRGILQNIQATVEDVNYYLDQATQVASAYANIMVSVGNIADALSAFTGGVERLIRVPRLAIQETARSIERLVAFSDDWSSMSLEARGWWRDLEKSLEAACLPRQAYEEDPLARLSDRLAAQSGEAGYSGSELALAAGTIGGTGARTTDTQRALARPAEQAGQAYSGFVEIEVATYHTPDGIAAAYGVPWAVIAAANGLRAPYICEADLPGTVAPGERIVIPLRGTTAPFLAAAAPGVESGGSQQEDLFGVDWLLDAEEGLVVDRRGGSLDYAMVSGVDNALQGVGIRLATERGANVCYPFLGRSRKVGTVNSLEAQLLDEVECRRSILEDDRVAKVVALTVERLGDCSDLTVDLELTNHSATRAQGRIS